MNTQQRTHLEALIRDAVDADRRNDAAARRRAAAEAINTYAYCTAAQWRRRFAAAARAAADK